MKKGLLSLMAVGLMATAANAATIGLRWAETPNQNLDALQGTIEVYMSLLAGDAVSTVIFDYVASDENLVATAQGTGLTGWGHSGATGLLGGLQFSAAANPGFVLNGPADVVIGTTAITAGAADGLTKNIFANVAGNPAGVLNAAGARLTWDARYNTGYAGYIAYGDWGNPGWGTSTLKGHQPTPNPLLITKVPEPSSLALIALGGLAMLRRRR